MGHPPGRRGRAARAAAGDEPIEGFWWLYVPLRFDDFAIVVIIQEDPDGHRVLNDAVRVWPAVGRPPTRAAGLAPHRHPLHVGHPHARRAPRSTSPSPTARRSTLEVETLGFVALNAGTGYGGDPTWTHGAWKGRDWVEGVDLDMTDPGRRRHGPVRPASTTSPRPRIDGAEGWGLFEHGTFGRHDPSGFADFGSVAP